MKYDSLLTFCRIHERQFMFLAKIKNKIVSFALMENLLKNRYHQISRYFASRFERAKMTEHTFMIIVAIIIGVLAGFSAIGIRWLIKSISELSFSGGNGLLDSIMLTPWYWKILIPVIGGLIVGPLIYFFAPEAKGHGVPEVMQAILLKGGNIRPRVAAIKALASAITIGTGGSVGREGPIIQIGASLGSTVGQFFRVPTKRLKTLVGCGAAAGIAAAFNAPIAGALFAVEIILMDFAVAQFSPIVISSVMATVISHKFEGKFAAFIVPDYQYVSPYEIGFYFLLGAACGFAAYLFIKGLYFAEDYFDNKLKMPEYLKPIMGGIGIGAIAIFFPHVMGGGYESINLALHGNLLLYFAFGLLFLQILATSLSLGSGGSGGIFASSLFMGAMLGLAFGAAVHTMFPDLSAEPGAYALVAMGGLVAGTTRAPITAIIIVFELTNDYQIILPLMITCIISMIVSSKLTRESIYTLKLVLRNLGIKEGTEINIMESMFTKDIYKTEFTPILHNDNFNTIVTKIIKGRGREFPVVDRAGNLKGVISVEIVKDYLFEKDSLSAVLIASDILTTEYESVTPDENCQSALDKMRLCNYEGIPVIDNEASQTVIGMIYLKDIQEAYNKEVERRDITSTLASSITMIDKKPNVHFLEGYEIAELHPPKKFIGKSIRTLNIRAKYGVDVLSIKSGFESTAQIIAIPNPDHLIDKDDVLVIAGEIKKINFLRNLS